MGEESSDRLEEQRSTSRVPAIALLVLALGTLIAIALLQPSIEDGAAQAWATYGWFVVILVPGVLNATVDLVAGGARLLGRGWGKPFGIVGSGATLLGMGWILTSTAERLGEPTTSGELVSWPLVAAALATLAAVALVLQLTMNRWAIAGVAVVPVVAMFGLFGWHELSMQPGCPSVSRSSDTSGRLAFVANAAICLANLDSGESRVVYESPHREEFEGQIYGFLSDPAISPDGRLIAFVQDDDELMTVGVDGSDPKRIVSGINPAWSPDGRSIAYGENLGDGNGRISIVDVDSGQSRVLAVDGWEPAWSPDGSTIALSRACHLSMMNADGTGLRELPIEPVGCLGSPDWSPDGSLIAFVDDLLQPGGPSYAAVLISHADGSGTRSMATPPSGEDYVEPAWGPDSRHIAFIHVDSDRMGQLRIVGVNDGLMQTIAGGAGYPDWVP